ncbi:Lrp/AsnC ligand binding domain-containing protein [Reyranella sp.]|uniref:Lrp/AsnC family transcriptional regulator n=1 Tax=Reyranella sp. TaxID=1929291 RepID=UPI0025CE70CA|nr:Lrp/AsnC ligand binding domain-containing protein [Reyranella sp.]
MPRRSGIDRHHPSVQTAGHVNRLECEGCIESYYALFGRERIELRLSVLVGVKINGHANDRATAFEDEVVAFPEVIACQMISGEADYLLEVIVPNLHH